RDDERVPRGNRVCISHGEGKVIAGDDSLRRHRAEGARLRDHFRVTCTPRLPGDANSILCYWRSARAYVCNEARYLTNPGRAPFLAATPPSRTHGDVASAGAVRAGETTSTTLPASCRRSPPGCPRLFH